MKVPSLISVMITAQQQLEMEIISVTSHKTLERGMSASLLGSACSTQTKTKVQMTSPINYLCDCHILPVLFSGGALKPALSLKLN